MLKGKTAYIIMCALWAASLSSCFKDGLLNSECDIEAAHVPLAGNEGMFFHPGDTLVEVASADSAVTFSVRGSAALGSVAPVFKLSPGASIEPASGTALDFSGGGRRYTVVSEDGEWSRSYTVAFKRVVVEKRDTVAFDFEDYSPEPKQGKYYVWGGGWASGNPGFRISRGTAMPGEYPTTPMEDGFDGAAVCLETKSTGPFGVLNNKRIAAGNIFLGKFVEENALRNTLKATEFGVPFDKKPAKLTAYYKYSPGGSYQDAAGKAVEGRVDSAAVYAVFYRNRDAEGSPVRLYGDDVKTSPHIIAIADLRWIEPTVEWTKVEVPFEYLRGVSAEELAAMGCNLTVVFSSSHEGDKFEGAVGSRLLIDKVRIVCVTEE